MAYDSQSIQTIYNHGFTSIFGSAITLVDDLRRSCWELDWQLALLSLCVVPFLIGRDLFFRAQRFARDSTSIQEQESAVLAQAQEGLSSIRMVHAFGREEWEVQPVPRAGLRKACRPTCA